MGGSVGDWGSEESLSLSKSDRRFALTWPSHASVLMEPDRLFRAAVGRGWCVIDALRH